MTAYINPRLIATQGFALTPIALAVHGLLAILADEEKRSQVYGSGRMLAAPVRETLRGPQEEDGLVEKVLEKWAVIEAAQAARTVVPPKEFTVALPPKKIVITPGVKVDISPRYALLRRPGPLAPMPLVDALMAMTKREQARRNAEMAALLIGLAESL